MDSVSKLNVRGQKDHSLSPRMHLANWTSLGMMVIRFAWIAYRFVSSNSPTRYASAASCKAPMAVS